MFFGKRIMNTRFKNQKGSTQNLNQARLSLEKSKTPDMNELILEKIENLSTNMNNLSKDLNKELNNFKREIKQEIREDLREINQIVDKLALDTQKIKQRVEILEFKNEKWENEMIKIVGKEERELDEKAIAELKAKEKSVRIRGIPETKEGNIFVKLIEEIAIFMNKDPEFFENEIDKLFRVNSIIAKQKGLPRDVIVFFVRKTVRDNFLNLHNESPFRFDNQELRVLKDIPGRILRKRREYMNLTSFLRAEGVTYRWELPEGLTFWWKKKRIRILTPDQAKKFLRQTKNQSSPTREDRNDEIRNPPEKGEEEENPQDPQDPLPELEYDEQELILEELRLRSEEDREK